MMIFDEKQLPEGYQVRPMSLDYAEETVALLNHVTVEFSGFPKFSLDGMIGEWSLPECESGSRCPHRSVACWARDCLRRTLGHIQTLRS
jgi:hypothetical protein